MMAREETVGSVIKSFFMYAAESGFVSKKRSSLISPFFKNDFNLSAGHQYVVPVLGSKERVYPQKIVINEPCFRRIDLQKIGYSPFHLLLFEMGVVALIGFSQDIREWVEEVLRFTIKWLNEQSLDCSKLIFTICQQANVLGKKFGADKVSYNALKKLGCSEENIVWTSGRRNFIYSQGENRPAGYSIEIFYRSDEYFVEVASLNIYTHMFKGNSLTRTVNVAVGGGFGFERITYVKNSYRNVFQIDIFSGFMNLVRKYFLENEFLLIQPRLFRIGEILKALVFIISDGQLPDRSGRGKILKRLAKSMFSEIQYLGLPAEEIVERGICEFGKVYRERYPQILEKYGLIKDVILRLK